MNKSFFFALALACGCAPEDGLEDGPEDVPHGCAEDAGTGEETLASLAHRRGLVFGNFLFGVDEDPAFQAALAEFDMITLPVFFRLVAPRRGELDFALADAVIDAAPPNARFFVPGFSNDLMPDWLTTGDFSADELEEVLVAYVRAVIDHFEQKIASRVVAYEIVLEPLSWKGRGGLWNRIGLDRGKDQYEYMRIAFAAARVAAPRAKLYVDDFGTEGMDAKSDELLRLVTQLRDEGVPLDGVGLEGHYAIGEGGPFPPVQPADEIAANLKRLAEAGFESMITSVDISLRDGDGSTTRLAEQADAYRTLMRACLAVEGCKGFSTWGIGDRDSWIMQAHPGWGSPLLFDTAYRAKPAVDALKAELRIGCAR